MRVEGLGFRAFSLPTVLGFNRSHSDRVPWSCCRARSGMPRVEGLGFQARLPVHLAGPISSPVALAHVDASMLRGINSTQEQEASDT